MIEGWKKLAIQAAGFGAGAVLATALVIAFAYGWMHRPQQWSNTAITAKYTELTAARVGEEFHITIQYALTNNTKEAYSVPSQIAGTLMRRLPDDNSLAKFEDANWDATLTIPPAQSVNEKFIVIYKLADYGMTSKDIPDDNGPPSQEFVTFAGKRMKDMNGLVFYDFTKNYRIEMPSGWARAGEKGASEKK
jgi:hypothetical protein